MNLQRPMRIAATAVRDDPPGSELELKLQVPPEALRSLRAALRAHGARSQRLRAHYFDTANARLARAHIALRLRWLEPVFVTPRLHRVHHSPQGSGRNLGVVLTLWDRLRGTFVAGETPPSLPLGVPGEVGAYPQSWLRQQLEPLRRWRRSSA